MSVEHTDVGAYALDLLEPADKRAFEQHLAGCAPCTTELASLSPMAGLLADTKPTAPITAPGPAPVVDLLRRRARSERRRSRRWLVAGLAASIVLLAAGGVLGSILGDHGMMGPAEHLVMMGDNYSGSDPATRVRGTIGLETKAWGTHVALKLDNVHGPIPNCRLIAVDTNGNRQTITNWGVPQWGYGTPKSPDPLYVHGGTATQRTNIDHFIVEDLTNHRPLITINV